MAVGGVELVKRLAHRWHHGRGREKGRKEGSAHPTLSTPASLKPTRASHRQSAGTASAKRTSPLSLPAFRIIGSTVVAAAVVVGFFFSVVVVVVVVRRDAAETQSIFWRETWQRWARKLP